jgi:hypothetical protein
MEWSLVHLKKLYNEKNPNQFEFIQHLANKADFSN